MRRISCAILAVLLVVSGCTKSDTVPVTGTITLNGEPAENTEITFNPAGPGRIATGHTDASGRFKLATAKPDDGAMPGDYIVTLGEHYDKAPPLPPIGQPLPMRFPQQYGDPAKSSLKAKVEHGAKNDFTFDIKK